MAAEGTKDFVRVIASWFLPPLGVFLQVGVGMHLVVSIVLTLLGFLPGVIHAFWVIASLESDGSPSKAGGPTFVALCLAGFLPPVAVAMRAGVGGALVLNCILSLLFLIPGVLHALWVVVNHNE